jgi:hypothetical protein
MNAKLILHTKKEDGKGNITEMVLWKLPEPTPDRPHGIKYRCYYGNAKGRCIVRYDNESGKGDHKHIGEKEMPYKFKTVERLIQDFMDDIYDFKQQEDDENE